MDKGLSIPEMTGLEFLEEEHIYLLDGVQIPSVSKLMVQAPKKMLNQLCHITSVIS